MLIGSEENLCITTAHSSFTTNGPTIKPIVYSGFLGCVLKQIYHAVELGFIRCRLLDNASRMTGEQTQSQQHGKSALVHNPEIHETTMVLIEYPLVVREL